VIGKATEHNFGQLSNVLALIFVIPSFIVTEVRDVQFENARSPIDVTEFGKSTEVMDEQL
jgi:hypothetical protein